MSDGLRLMVNGRERVLAEVASPAKLADVLTQMDLRADRVAVELNGDLAPRATWAATDVQNGDRLEVVHFVGGGRR